MCKKVRTRCRNPPHDRFLGGCSSPFMRLAERLTALRAWCKQCLPGRCSPDVLRPGIVRMRVYGHATTAMHDMSTPPPSNHASSKDNIHISARDPKSNTTLACFFCFSDVFGLARRVRRSMDGSNCLQFQNTSQKTQKNKQTTKTNNENKIRTS